MSLYISETEPVQTYQNVARSPQELYREHSNVSRNGTSCGEGCVTHTKNL
ncbi:hypothetical protein CJ030_MR6G006598 [Morella rubra]|uniref:Uncharacterized protein n=1 Tax=Morella rubra TaxID=262757 RepID=A0A6A1VGD7_9ROSI|nr:hypothetical protein CJ030_MR6G006598 [Morella rubra]